MTNQIPLVAFICLTSLLCATGQQANEPAPKASKTSIGEQQLVAQDAIFITIAEITYAKDFMNSIPKLRSLSNANGEPGDEVLQCVGGLSEAMSNVLGELQKLQDSFPSLNLGTGPMESVVDVVLSYNVICERALRDVDGTIKLMVLRKIEDVVLLSNDVILRVAKLLLGSQVTRKNLN